ncbi:hypothetical protein M0802_015090 [Mischocyttarus mexicanus]|nr:hypothetical protein M0802_015090 [Mischocyttarus mexicanus]
MVRVAERSTPIHTAHGQMSSYKQPTKSPVVSVKISTGNIALRSGTVCQLGKGQCLDLQGLGQSVYPQMFLKLYTLVDVD